MKTEKWYYRRLENYFNEHYMQYEGVEWFPDPAINQWEFDILELNKRIVLTCYDNGNVTCSDWKLSDIHYRTLGDMYYKLDALYEDYIRDSIGDVGFDLMREQGHLELCGKINGRNLYTLR